MGAQPSRRALDEGNEPRPARRSILNLLGLQFFGNKKARRKQQSSTKEVPPNTQGFHSWSRTIPPGAHIPAPSRVKLDASKPVLQSSPHSQQSRRSAGRYGIDDNTPGQEHSPPVFLSYFRPSDPRTQPQNHIQALPARNPQGAKPARARLPPYRVGDTNSRQDSHVMEEIPRSGPSHPDDPWATMTCLTEGIGPITNISKVSTDRNHHVHGSPQQPHRNPSDTIIQKVSRSKLNPQSSGNEPPDALSSSQGQYRYRFDQGPEGRRNPEPQHEKYSGRTPRSPPPISQSHRPPMAPVPSGSLISRPLQQIQSPRELYPPEQYPQLKPRVGQFQSNQRGYSRGSSATKPIRTNHAVHSQTNENRDHSERPQQDSLTKITSQRLPDTLGERGGRSVPDNYPIEKQAKDLDKDRYYDRRYGEMAAEKRAGKSQQKAESKKSSTTVPASTSMKYYRPGDPNHPSVKPISAEFKRRHGFTLGGSQVG